MTRPIPATFSAATRAKKPVIKEGVVVNACIRWIFAQGGYAWRNNSGAYKTPDGRYIRFGEPGAADILALHPGSNGRLIAIECKSTTGRQKPEQRAWEAKIRQYGGVYILARSVDDLEAVKSQIVGAS